MIDVYKFSRYDKNRNVEFCPMDTRQLWDKNSKEYSDDKAIKYYQENPIEYSFNNYGFRTPDDFNHDDDGNIFLGCSHTFGIGHHLENTWSYKLNKFMGGKFWNLSQGGTGVDTAFRLLYGFKDYLNGKNIFHYAPTFHSYRYEFIIESEPRLMNILYDNGRHAKRFLGNRFVEESLADDRVAKLNYDKSIYAIESLSEEMGCNYYVLTESILGDYKDDNSIKARDFTHHTIGEQTHIYDSFLNII